MLLAALLFGAVGASARPAPTVVLRIDTKGVITGTDHLRCLGRCWIPFRRGSLVTLHAAAPRHFEFDGWSGGCVGAAPICVVSLDQSVSVSASFVGKPTFVSLSVSGPGRIVSHPKGLVCGAGLRLSCDGEFPWGTRLTLSAKAQPTGRFAAWGAACWNVGLGSCTLKLAGDEADVMAAFRHAVPGVGPQTLTVTGVVTSKPAGIDCPGACTASFPSGTRVRLNASSWAGGCFSFQLDRCLVVLDAPTTVTSVRSPPNVKGTTSGYGVSVSVSGRGAVKAPGIDCNGVSGTLSDCQNLFEPNAHVSLKARAATNGQFLGWGLFCKNFGTKPVCKLSIFTPMLVGARFKL